MKTASRRASRRKGPRTTCRAEEVRPAPDLIDRDFAVSGPDRLWVADITYVPTWAGFLFLAVVLDAWSRRVVGWSIATHLRTELVLEALDHGPRAAAARSGDLPLGPGLPVYFDRLRPALWGSRRAASMGSVGDCYDNAFCESFFATLQCELLEQRRFRSQQAEAGTGVFEFI